MAIDFFGGKKAPFETVNITSYNQSGGITAHTVNNFGPQPRRLDQRMGTQLLGMLTKGKKVTVVAVMGDQEAFMFANEVLQFLKAQGYEPHGVDQAMYSQPVIGQSVNQKGDAYEVIIGGRG